MLEVNDEQNGSLSVILSKAALSLEHKQITKYEGNFYNMKEILVFTFLEFFWRGQILWLLGVVPRCNLMNQLKWVHMNV